MRYGKRCISFVIIPVRWRMDADNEGVDWIIYLDVEMG